MNEKPEIYQDTSPTHPAGIKSLYGKKLVLFIILQTFEDSLNDINKNDNTHLDVIEIKKLNQELNQLRKDLVMKHNNNLVKRIREIEELLGVNDYEFSPSNNDTLYAPSAFNIKKTKANHPPFLRRSSNIINETDEYIFYYIQRNNSIKKYGK